MWKALGFTHSPYDTSPLRTSPEDVELLVGRDSEAVELHTVLDSKPQGVLVLSGLPGVGKTSFFNVQQYLLESGLSSFGPQLLAARRLCPVQPGDNASVIALRVLAALIYSVQELCTIRGEAMPSESAKIRKWLNGGGSGSGFELGIQILGFGGNVGRQVTLPHVNDASFERLQDVITCIVSEVVNRLKLQGVFCALDNVENLGDKELADMLMSFRDTLFSVPGVWWVVIGQSGLGSLIQTLDPRVSERISGTGLELRPLSKTALHDAIGRRVERFHKATVSRAPLPSETHDHLYDASHGEIRFVFKYSNSICEHFVKEMRVKVLERSRPKRYLGPVTTTALVDEAIGQVLVSGMIPAPTAESILARIVANDIAGLKLRPHDARILSLIGLRGGARAKDFKEYGLKSGQDFSSNYLSRFHKAHLLSRQQEGRRVLYTLRGIAAIGAEYGILEPAGTQKTKR